MKTVFVGQTRLDINWQVGRLLTTLPGGYECLAEPQSDEHYRATAAELGYGDDLVSMAIDNDALHSWICWRAGQPHCPVLLGTSLKRWWPWWQQEDNVVLAIQALSRGRTVEDLAFYRREALEQYVYWARPKAPVNAVVAVAESFLTSLRGE